MLASCVLSKQSFAVKGARFNKLAVAVRRMEELREKKGIEPVEISNSPDIPDFEDNQEQ